MLTKKPKTRFQILQPEAFEILINNRQKDLNIVLFEGDILKNVNKIREYEVQAVSLIEVIEHLYPFEIPKLESNLFESLEPMYVIVTTPNYEFNAFFEKENRANNRY